MHPDFIEAQAASIPDRPALWFDEQWYTYAELNRRACRLANRLSALGIERGDRVGILAWNHVAHVDLTLAATKLGHVHLPLNHRLGVDELCLLLIRVSPALILVDPPHEPLLETLSQTLDLRWLRLSDYEAWLAAASDAPLTRTEPLTAEDVHMILFTGGSTGVPKGACLPYRQTLGNAADTAAIWGLDSEDCVIQCTPCFHAAVNVLCLPLLMAGGRVVLMPRFDPQTYLSLAVQHAVTWLFMVPTMFRALAAEPAFKSLHLPKLRGAITGGAPCPPALQAQYAERGIGLRQGYGMTEAGVNCFVITAEQAAAQPSSVGRPMPGVTVELRREDGSLIGTAGEVGEITLSGPQICQGYYSDADATEAQAFRDGWLWTGDLACFDDQGLFSIRGRRKDLYISGGENVYPAEIEAALSACRGVAECAVFGWPHTHWGECGIAVIVLDPGCLAEGFEPAHDLGTNISEDDHMAAEVTMRATLRTELRSRLAGYKMPAEFVFVAALPRSASGKIVKRDVRALYEALQAPADLSAAA